MRLGAIYEAVLVEVERLLDRVRLCAVKEGRRVTYTQLLPAEKTLAWIGVNLCGERICYQQDILVVQRPHEPVVLERRGNDAWLASARRWKRTCASPATFGSFFGQKDLVTLPVTHCRDAVALDYALCYLFRTKRVRSLLFVRRVAWGGPDFHRNQRIWVGQDEDAVKQLNQNPRSWMDRLLETETSLVGCCLLTLAGVEEPLPMVPADLESERIEFGPLIRFANAANVSKKQ